jgi:hypothetical protein
MTIVRHEVRDYGRWRPIFDAAAVKALRTSPWAHAHHINALRQALKQGPDGIAHACSPGGVVSASFASHCRSVRRSFYLPRPTRPSVDRQ